MAQSTQTTPKSRNEWLFGQVRKKFSKKQLMETNILTMLNRTIRMFEYTGLPDTIPAKDLELYLQVNGFAIFAKPPASETPYAFFGSMAGEPNAYYLPTRAIVANPYLRFNRDMEIDTECVVLRNDNFYLGLMPMFRKYATLMTEAELSLKQACINARIPALVQADNDNTAGSAKEFFRKVTDGEDFGVVMTNDFFDGLSTHTFTQNEKSIKDLIEVIQYIRGTWFNEIGLESTFNMKRESLNVAETTLNDDVLAPTVDQMLENRREGLKRINEMFGLNIEVELSGAWKDNAQLDDILVEQQEQEVSGNENENQRDSNPDRDEVAAD